MRFQKWVVSFLLIMMVLVVTACSSSEDANSGSGNTLEDIKKRGKLVAGVKYDTYLFGYKDPSDKQVKGFEIDLMKAFAKKILGDENKIEFKEVTSKTRIKLLDAGDIDLIAATMTVSPERQKQVDFSRIYFLAGQSLLVKNDSTIKSINDLKGKKVSTSKGSTSAKNMKKMAPDAILEEYENYADSLTALKSGKVDAVTTDDSILMGMQQQNPDLKLVGGQFTKEPYGIAVKKGNSTLQKELNTFIQEIWDNGQYATLYKKWFKKDAPKELPTDAILEAK
ncbi:glutamate ABC transporter substrate-binding protein [Shimazuella alba]|uniref:Transporter substrate-binding domain-containing protein n=1 Tax=Shimazuella alba TaxID=2690964 RepID=A0A6I4W0E7_9BACL|nr:glutamate ABC transporter substrate-binding protein [Shimazuella alba]MXQ55710.1 transporter substrate-binding domain-containing protein [Shimazuella alba]